MTFKQRLLAGGLLLVATVIGLWLINVVRRPTEKPENIEPPEPVALALDRQREIWDAEHVTFELERRFGPIVLAALTKRNPERFARLQRPGFSASTLGAAEATSRSHAGITESVRTGSRHPQTADELFAALIAPLSELEQINSARLRILRIEARAETWQARLLLTFHGTTSDGSPAFFESEHFIACTIENAREIDRVAILDNWTIERETGRSSTRRLMEEVTVEAGLANLPVPDNWNLPVGQILQYRFQLAVADYDRDGFPDLAIAALGQPPILLRNDAGRGFRNVSVKLELDDPRQPRRLNNFLAGWIDYDNDGFPDLLLGTKLYRNVSGQRFVDVTASSGLTFAPECMGCIVADYDADGRLDLYVLYQKPFGKRVRPEPRPQWVDDTGSGNQNQLWHNEGNGRFRDVTRPAGAGGGDRHTHAAAWFFHDDDHFPDLYLANDFGRNVVLRNRGDGSFEDVSGTAGASGFATSMGVATGDVDGDGRSDVYVANMYSKMGRRIIGLVGPRDYPAGIYRQIQGSCAGNRLYLAGDRSFAEHSERLGVNAVGWAYAPAIADFDNDGHPDLYATTGFLSFDRKKPDG